MHPVEAKLEHRHHSDLNHAPPHHHLLLSTSSSPSSQQEGLHNQSASSSSPRSSPSTATFSKVAPTRLSPMRHPLTTHTTLGSPILTARLRSCSLGNSPVGWNNPVVGVGSTSSIPVMSPYTSRSMPVSPVLAYHLQQQQPPDLPLFPPEPSETQKAMEAAAAKERARAKALEEEEATMTADELRAVLKRERHRTGRMAADLAALRSASVQSQLEAEVVEEGRINGLMRRMDMLQQEKGRIIVELEREEEMLTNTLQKKLNEVRGEKEVLEKQIEREKKAHLVLQSQLSDLRNKHLSIAEALEEEEEMEEED